ncbi:hypothetical protein APHWI1_0159 [Anaplasma phagocytophilum str. ApWI1]|uniref:Uncharacterized protein n=3 Tax=Anaplasma phagocytophilum TaxID=948 RepID=Q2GK52_ANAPZ|nr:hypothetical protein APH_0667 [Anaplasma phagocytophilum str. HZ]KJV60246.1 hypothetical protein APHWEB_1356 [Anaplasma phagocytophilum str. Webster]KJV65195.1 hypothetical protein EPHNCH_0972 [Anaplasma phagocytophilum str. NCH-1]KJV82558.1 hypothetical protein APHHGE2_0956 [Anaplasma phagocytophilum str. HGE2]KJV84569.1 hypothetical protein APHWI1_0159 [Anaplasma phagocytophilum str. ApWI1]KJV87424.1 hypothetical protein APHNYW_0668 [Anaplasma phagocytophilum str. ApNYW]KJV98709.1 hypoth
MCGRDFSVSHLLRPVRRPVFIIALVMLESITKVNRDA